MQIKNRYTDAVLWEGEQENIREELMAAVAAGANLVGADLGGANLGSANLVGADLGGANLGSANLVGADLGGANLGSANLRGANLVDANLVDANLGGANLRGAYLGGANLRGAYLGSANLGGANLVGANLGGADLGGANLGSANLVGADLGGANLGSANLVGAYLVDAYLVDADLGGANLGGANLRGANLGGAKGVIPHRVQPLLMLLDQPGPTRAYKLVTSSGDGPYYPSYPGPYVVGGSYSVGDANTDVNELGASGINIATLDWCLKEWEPDLHILIVEFNPEDIAAIPTASDGKFRLHRCRVVGEKDLTGLVPSAGGTEEGEE